MYTMKHPINHSSILELALARERCIITKKVNSKYAKIMKGDKRLRKRGFKKGNKYGKGTNLATSMDPNSLEGVCYVRPTAEEAELMAGSSVVNQVLSSAQSPSERSTTTMFLRCRPAEQSRSSNVHMSGTNNREDPGCYKLFHTEKLWEMVNTVTKEHWAVNPGCRGDLGFDINSAEQRVFVWRERVTCHNCKYRSNMHKLYEEVKGEEGKGRKSATVNIGINVALMQTPIAATSLRKILAGGNIPPPSVSGIHKRNAKLSTTVIDANKSDMQRRRKQLCRINRWQGRPEKQIAVQSDGVYNNNLYSGVGRTPFQPATQATYTVAENMTQKQQQIIAMDTVNKLCSKHGFHSHADECTLKNCPTTASMETNIGDEARWAENCFRDLSKDGLEVKYLTTDGDTKAFQAVSALHKDKLIESAPEHQLDTRHLCENHRKQMKNNVHVQHMMPGRTAQIRLKLRNRFATDISKRCQSEFDCIVERVRDNYTLLHLRVKDCIAAIKKCYGGVHSDCKTHSYVCKGLTKDNWLYNSSFLPPGFKINIKNEDFERTLLECIEYRLGDDVVCLTRLNTNTQKVEGSNRAIKRSLPKTVTFTRNFEARAHSAVFSVNNGPGEAISKLCKKAGCPIPAGGKVAAQLLSLQRRSEKKKQREKTLAFKQKRRQRRNKLFKLYEEHSEQKNYVKGQLMRVLRKSTAHATSTKNEPSPSTSNGHNYTRNPRNNKKVRGRRIISGKCPLSNNK